MRRLPRCLYRQCHPCHPNRGPARLGTACARQGAEETVISNAQQIKNLLVAGIGRQGINSLAKVLARVCLEAGCSCQYTVHKGGAQSLGSVYAELRIAQGELPVLGPSIPPGKLDILVALDPWEALRHLRLGHAGTACYVETEIMPLFTDRSATGEREAPRTGPIEQLNRLGLQINWRQYRQDAVALQGSSKMSNYFAGIDCLNALGLTNLDDYNRIFSDYIPAAQVRVPA